MTAFLSVQCRCEIVNFMFNKVISGAPFFEARPKAFIVQLVSILRLEHYGPGEVVVRQGDEGSSMYFVAEGELQVRLHKDAASARQAGDSLDTAESLNSATEKRRLTGTDPAGRIIATLKSGQYFGEVTCFSGS